ncbi:MAG: hypothetical protein ABII07_03620 [Patescibacteria group bacterium]|nr:hypothetical protein [Patescibacteria group bacterium]
MTDQKSKIKENPEDEPIKKVTKKKVVYIELDEEITSVYDRVKQFRFNDIYLVVPRRAVLLESVVNLKILKKKLEEDEKTLYVITNDPVGTKLAFQAGIKVYDKIDDDSKITKEILNPELKIQPITATSNEYEEISPERLPSKRLSILELVKNFKENKKKGAFNLKSLWDIQKKYRKAVKEKKKFSIPGGPNRKAMTTLMIASVTMLLVIFYVALPGATIYVTPESNVLEASANITLADSVLNASELDSHPSHMIASYEIETTAEVTITYDATGELFSGENSTGTITLTNEADYKWDLVAFTRLQSPDGVVFRTQQFASVPAATDLAPGKLDVYVVADEFDAYDDVIGARGNLEAGTHFILPGLRASSQTSLYGENVADLSGGETIVTKYVLEEDLDAAYLRVESELYDKVGETLQAEVDRLNLEQGTNLDLLTGGFAFDTSTVVISLPEVEGELMDTFQVTGYMDVSGIAYNHDELVNILRNELKLRKSPEKQLNSIDESSLYHDIFEIDDSAKKIKITASIKGIEEYVLDPSEESGARLVKKIKDHIAGKPVKEAEEYIQNLSEVNTVEIKSWPVWAPTIPSVAENIKIKLVED